MLAAEPGLSVEEIRTILLDTATPWMMAARRCCLRGLRCAGLVGGDGVCSPLQDLPPLPKGEKEGEVGEGPGGWGRAFRLRRLRRSCEGFASRAFRSSIPQSYIVTPNEDHDHIS